LTGETLTTCMKTVCALPTKLKFFTNFGLLDTEVWEATGGKEGLHLLASLLSDVRGAILFYDSEDVKVLDWKKTLRKLFCDIPVVFVRSKADLQDATVGWSDHMTDLLRFQDYRDKRVQSAILCALLCFRRMGVSHDMRKVIAQLVWETRCMRDWNDPAQQPDEKCGHCVVSTQTNLELDMPFILLGRMITQMEDLHFVENYGWSSHPIPEWEVTPEMLAQYERELHDAQFVPMPEDDDM
jgi:hypothetical protein